MTAPIHTATRDGITLTVWMISLELWAYRATRGIYYAKGNVSAIHWMDAWEKAFDIAKVELSLERMYL